MIKIKNIITIAIAGIILFLSGCTSHPSIPDTSRNTNREPKIYPDYKGVTVPCNIAPLNFAVKENSDRCVAHITYGDKQQTYGKDYKIVIPEDEWKEMLAAAKGKSIEVEIFTEKDGEWQAYSPFRIYVAEEEIDPYISYRLIPPSYVAYEKLSINQRNLTNFEERVIYKNMIVSNEKDAQCINCHSYQNYKTDNMQFHMRQSYGGTMIVNDGKLRKIDMKSDSTLSAGVYPAWHPTEKLIAYSTNLTGQSFHTKDIAKIEVQDTKSDLILYDVEKNEISTICADEDEFEVFPTWSPDGKTLYYSSAHFEYRDTVAEETEQIQRYNEVKYDIYRRSFDVATKTFGNRELVYSASSQNKSATLPRISPDGRHLLFAMGNHGCFHIWHPESDIYLTDLKTMKTRKLENANSPKAESYHSWSSNGRWIIISSRRDDGNFTRPFIAYFDKTGHAHKAFEVPQKDPDFYTYFLYSYNIPEFMVEPVKTTPQEFASAAKANAVKATYKGK
ncbi:MAG: hypothetical protein NC206_06365 [Bacteroides sp.]|nr:hypothetical protein [Roseburia sp.]MCM1346692.1 hypothetical protein [Bacteroides sp.]MCM1419948.1 hypothetical protein [Bacteroides sp.]